MSICNYLYIIINIEIYKSTLPMIMMTMMMIDV